MTEKPLHGRAELKEISCGNAGAGHFMTLIEDRNYLHECVQDLSAESSLLKISHSNSLIKVSVSISVRKQV